VKTKDARIIFALLACASFLFTAYLLLAKNEAEKPTLLFAYGANLDPAAMKARAGGFEGMVPAKLGGFRLAFQTNKRTEFGVANIVADKSASVPGAVYNLTSEQMALLDKSAGYPNFYGKKNVLVKTPDGREIAAIAYALAGEPAFASPSRTYLDAVIKGLANAGYGKEEETQVGLAAIGR